MNNKIVEADDIVVDENLTIEHIAIDVPIDFAKDTVNVC